MKRLLKMCLLSAVIACALMIFLCAHAGADSVEYGDLVVTGGVEGRDFSHSGSTITILTSTPLTLSGSTTTEKVQVDNGVSAYITLDNCTIDLSAQSYGASIRLGNGNKLVITLSGVNMLKGGSGCAALGSTWGTTGTLTIGGDGSLEAIGGSGGAGIGGDSKSDGSHITINSGTITAQGRGGAAGIGGGAYGNASSIQINGGEVYATSRESGGSGIGGGMAGYASSITITGGKVYATGGSGGAGIGGGARSVSDVGNISNEGTGGLITIIGGEVYANGKGGGAGIGGGVYSMGGPIRITGGKVYATSSSGAGIGGGYKARGYEIAISGENTVVIAAETWGGEAIGSGSSATSPTGKVTRSGGLVVENKVGALYGDTVTILDDVTLESGTTLAVGNGQTLTVGEDSLLTNDGVIDILAGGTLTILGDVTGSGTITGGGTVNKKEQIAAPDAPAAVSVTASSITLNVPADSGVFGVEYSLDNSTWQDSPTFTELTPATGYTFYVRFKGNDYYSVSASSSTVIYTIAIAPALGTGFMVDYAAETAVTTSGYELRVSPEDQWTVETVTVVPGGTLYVRSRAVSGGVDASDATENILPTRPDVPTGIAVVSETVDGKCDGVITGTSEGTEYRGERGGWTSCEDERVSGLAPGAYAVRFAATDHSFAGLETVVTISVGVPATYILAVEIPQFEPMCYGDGRPAAHAITITNSGNSDATITVSITNESEFTLSGSGLLVPAGGTIDTWSVQPVAGLNAGNHEAQVTVTYDGGKTVSVDLNFQIQKAVLASADIFTMDISDENYTGQAVIKDIRGTLGGTTLAEGTDYTVVYADNIAVGVATITIIGKGNYTGTLEYTFAILPGVGGDGIFDFGAFSLDAGEIAFVALYDATGCMVQLQAVSATDRLLIAPPEGVNEEIESVKVFVLDQDTYAPARNAVVWERT